MVFLLDIIDIKPSKMDELSEVITVANFHPENCNYLLYGTNEGAIKFNDMRLSSNCDKCHRCNSLHII